MHSAVWNRRRSRRLTVTVAAAAAAVSTLSLSNAAEGVARPALRVDSTAHLHQAHGRPLLAATGAPGRLVRDYLASVGAGAGTVSSLHGVGPAWSSNGVGHLRMGQVVAGLRVHGTDVKASFDRSGHLVALVENAAPVHGVPVAASASSADALRAAVGSLYPGRQVDAAATAQSGNVTTYPRQGFVAAPTVEKVAVPTADGGLAEGYEVTTWAAHGNQLSVTLVSGDGRVVDTEVRTAEDAYNVFPESPDVGKQRLVRNPADTLASPGGWLSGSQLSVNISGNNAHAYLDRNNDDAADAGGTAVTGGTFGAVADLTAQPTTSTNQAVAVQNLFYLNNLIHDTLYRAGFTEGAGNFQVDNFGKGGRAGDPVQAEAQDGGGTDNANFATPTDGQVPRMQMYLWTVPGMFEVLGADGVRYNASTAEWGAAPTATGVTGPTTVANDGTGVTSDACEPIAGDLTGTIAIVDRGGCTFVQKALNVQAAGAKGVIVANNAPGAPIVMGGTDRRLTITGMMVSQADGATLKSKVPLGATLRLTQPAPPLRDGDVDSDIVWHEYGHGLTWRMIGRMDGPMAGAIGEGMSDVLSVIVNDDPVVGEYAFSDPGGLRTHSYEGYNRTYADVHGEEVHLDGEVYGAIGWDLWKRYKAARLGRGEILSDLVQGMNFTPAAPTYEQMRDGILAGLDATGRSSRACMVWDAFAKYGVGVGASGKVSGNVVATTASSAVPAGCPAP